jgi:hypothetical protein
MGVSCTNGVVDHRRPSGYFFETASESSRESKQVMAWQVRRSWNDAQAVWIHTVQDESSDDGTARGNVSIAVTSGNVSRHSGNLKKKTHIWR